MQSAERALTAPADFSAAKIMDREFGLLAYKHPMTNPTADRSTKPSRSPRVSRVKALPGSGTAKSRISRAEQGARSRAAILDAALTFFAERGYHGTSLDDITVMSGAKRSNILYHFKTKMDLWRGSVEVAVSAFNDALAENLDRVAAIETTPDRRNVTAWLDAFLEQPRLAQLMVLEGGRSGERLDWLIQHFNHSAIPFASPDLRRNLNTVLRDAIMAIFLAMTALGPLMEASLAKVTGETECGVFPLSAGRREELIELLLIIMRTFERNS